jgi:capsular polysaccharide biosynthesis protein
MEARDYTELDLRELAGTIWKRWWMILLITFLFTAISGVFGFFVLTPEYKASAEILVTQSKVDGNVQYSQGDIRTNLELMNTYNVIIKSPRILDKVIENYSINKSYGQLNNQITVSSVKNSQVMSITVIDPSHEQAVYIANAVAQTFQEEIKQLMNVDNVHIMAEAKNLPIPSPVKPNPHLNMAIAFVVGLMTSIGLIFLLEYLDNTVKSESDTERLLGIPVLGSISKIDEKTEKKLKARLQAQIGGEQLEI